MIVSCIYAHPLTYTPLGDNRTEYRHAAIGAIDRAVIYCLSMDATLWHTMALKAPSGLWLPRPAANPKFHAVSFFSLENAMRNGVCINKKDAFSSTAATTTNTATTITKYK